MAAQIIAGNFANVLSRGGLSRAVSLLQRAQLSGVSASQLFQQTFIDLSPRELSAMVNTARNAMDAGERMTVLPQRQTVRNAAGAPLGVQGGGPLAGVTGRATIIVENPFGGDDIWVVRNLTGSETRLQLQREALREAARIVAGSPGRFTPDRGAALTELGALRLLNRDAEVSFRDVYLFE